MDLKLLEPKILTPSFELVQLACPAETTAACGCGSAHGAGSGGCCRCGTSNGAGQ